MANTKLIISSKQPKNEFLSHQRLLEQLESDPIYNKMTTNKLNKLFHETGELSSEFLIRRTHERINGPKAGRYKIIPDRTSNLFKKNVKNKVDALAQAMDYLAAKFGLEEELEEYLKNNV